jgi:hypothetical protein
LLLLYHFSLYYFDFVTTHPPPLFHSLTQLHHSLTPSLPHSHNHITRAGTPAPAPAPDMDRSPLNFTPNNTNKNDKKERECFSSGKRSHREEARESSSMDVDDLVSMISSKLEHLDTSDSLESLIAVFMEVLKCSQKEAEFFLDSVSCCCCCSI